MLKRLLFLLNLKVKLSNLATNAALSFKFLVFLLILKRHINIAEIKERLAAFMQMISPPPAKSLAKSRPCDDKAVVLTPTQNKLYINKENNLYLHWLQQVRYSKDLVFKDRVLRDQPKITLWYQKMENAKLNTKGDTERTVKKHKIRFNKWVECRYYYS